MKLPLTNNTLYLRTVNSSDVSLLFKIYASTREQEMERLVDWSDDQKNMFVMQQFTAQDIYYRQHYRESDFYIIEQNEQPIGRLYLDGMLMENSVRIIDITLLPEHRNKGIGTSLLKDILNYATRLKKSVSIHVESFNPAMELYKKLGFKLVDKTNGVYYLMEHTFENRMLQELAV